MNITDLKPALIWQCFDEITRVPRPTHHLDKMREFLVDWANRHNIAVKTDAVGMSWRAGWEKPGGTPWDVSRRESLDDLAVRFDGL